MPNIKHSKQVRGTYDLFLRRLGIPRGRAHRAAPVIVSFLVIAVLGGAYYQLVSRAATFATSKEAENGTLSGNATVTSGTSASNGQFVQFGSRQSGIAVAGNKFYLNSKPFTPHGFNAIAMLYSQWCSDSATTAADKSFSTSELNYAKSEWNANTLRFQVSQPVLASVNGAAYAKQISGEVATVRNAGFVVDISMQDEGHACGPAEALPSSETKQAWTTLINNTTLKNDPYIMFELYNEPQNSTNTAVSTDSTVWNWPDWQTGGRQISDPKSPPKWSPYTSVGMQSLVNYMRGTLGVTNVLIADGAHFAGSLQDVPLLTDPSSSDQIAYAIHPYTYTDPTDYAARWGDLSANKPVIATEWNCYYNTSSSMPAETASFLSYMRTTVHVGILGHAMDTGGLFNPSNTCGNLFLTDYTNYFAPG